ncbi:MAG: demethoxyubiquinone hydroxylase family protein [Kordiimonas sp.]|nr:demethoxyubiquinone hydroxylase family protein [Kordiimonas sp.]
MAKKTRKTAKQKTAAGRIAADPTAKELVDRFIRVDHAGEYGATRIYAGQLAVLGENHPLCPTIRHMAAQEDVHLDHFNHLITQRGVRPTALTPFWHVAGFALGAATALMGEKAALACTAAVEDVIDEHYREQLDSLGSDEQELAETIEKFRQEELEHHDTALDLGAADTPGYELLSGLIKGGCRLAIKVAEKI